MPQASLYDNFPDDFKWGSTSSACSIEGAWNMDGRSMSWWDSSARRKSNAIATAVEKSETYNKFQEDVLLLKEMNATCYKFSLSWSRLLPDGTTNKVNQAGVEYYNTLINSLLSNGIEPIIILYHWDFPQELFEKHPFNWMDESVVKAFGKYAQFCFKKFGDRVKSWITIHDPWKHSQSQCTDYSDAPNANANAKKGGSGSPIRVFRNLIKAHSLAYRIYAKDFRPTQQGCVGISINSKCISSSENKCLRNEVAVPDLASLTEPKTNLNPDVSSDFGQMCWRELRMTKFDFVDLTYEDIHSQSQSNSKAGSGSRLTVPASSSRAQQGRRKSSIPALHNIRFVLNLIRSDLNNPEVLLCGKGYPLTGPEITTLEELKASKYFQDYVAEILQAIVLDECRVRGFLPGTLVDSWEWEHGFLSQVQQLPVKFDDSLKFRVQRLSVKYLSKLFQVHEIAEVSKILKIDLDAITDKIYLH